jgi:hypothetical protein
MARNIAEGLNNPSFGTKINGENLKTFYFGGRYGERTAAGLDPA